MLERMGIVKMIQLGVAINFMSHCAFISGWRIADFET